MGLNINLQFSGGAELLVGDIKEHKIILEENGSKWNIQQLLVWIKDNILQQRPELFLKGNTVRPGILVLINDADWLLMDELNYELEENDIITFISTLHGG